MNFAPAPLQKAGSSGDSEMDQLHEEQEGSEGSESESDDSDESQGQQMSKTLRTSLIGKFVQVSLDQNSKPLPVLQRITREKALPLVNY